MREVLAIAVIVGVFAPGAGAFHTTAFTVYDTTTVLGDAWYAARLLMTDDPSTPAVQDPEARIVVSASVDDWTHLGYSFTLWDGSSGELAGGVVGFLAAGGVGPELQTRLVGDAVVEPLRTRFGAGSVELEFRFHICCAEGHALLTVASDGAVGDVVFELAGNSFATLLAKDAGAEAFFFLNGDFDALAHIALETPDDSAGVRAMYSGSTHAIGATGEFVGIMFATSDLGDPPEWCHLRILGPRFEAESDGGDNDEVCSLVARAPEPGDYDLRVERFLAPNALSEDGPNVWAVGGFVTFP